VVQLLKDLAQPQSVQLSEPGVSRGDGDDESDDDSNAA
jgi:hypothetical protein